MPRTWSRRPSCPPGEHSLGSGAGEFDAWFERILVNTARSHVRRRSVTPISMDRQWNDPDYYDDNAPGRHDPALASVDASDALGRAINRLTSDQRSIDPPCITSRSSRSPRSQPSSGSPSAPPSGGCTLRVRLSSARWRPSDDPQPPPTPRSTPRSRLGRPARRAPTSPIGSRPRRGHTPAASTRGPARRPGSPAPAPALGRRDLGDVAGPRRRAAARRQPVRRAAQHRAEPDAEFDAVARPGPTPSAPPPSPSRNRHRRSSQPRTRLPRPRWIRSSPLIQPPSPWWASCRPLRADLGRVVRSPGAAAPGRRPSPRHRQVSRRGRLRWYHVMPFESGYPTVGSQPAAATANRGSPSTRRHARSRPSMRRS